MVFKSKGEEKLYNIIFQYITQIPLSNLKIIREFKLKKLGCPKNFSIDFMLTNQYEQPLLAIECQGLYHYKDAQVMERDKYKMAWLHDNFIIYLPIPWYNNQLRFDEAMKNRWNEPWLAEEEDFRFLLEDINNLAKEKIAYSIKERKIFRKQQIEYYKNYYALKTIDL